MTDLSIFPTEGDYKQLKENHERLLVMMEGAQNCKEAPLCEIRYTNTVFTALQQLFLKLAGGKPHITESDFTQNHLSDKLTFFGAHDNDGDGVISPSEFLETINKQVLTVEIFDSAPLQNISVLNAFKWIKAEANNKVESYITDMVNKMGQELPNVTVKGVYMKCIIGEIQWLDATISNMRTQFDSLDSRKTNELTADTIPPAARHLWESQLCVRFDNNGDNKIEWDEFVGQFEDGGGGWCKWVCEECILPAEHFQGQMTMAAIVEKIQKLADHFVHAKMQELVQLAQ